MHPLDWFFACIPVLLAFVIGVYTRRYVKSVADLQSENLLCKMGWLTEKWFIAEVPAERGVM